LVKIVPYSDSLGMNEQELPNLHSLLTTGELVVKIVPYSDSLGMNEQELPNLHSLLTTGM
jgi:ADP-dependent phosphofructokinase/glucokinase